MSENIQNNLFLSGRTFPVGCFHFIELAGPPLGPGMGMEAVEFLHDCGMEFTPEGLRRDAHKFGWLWKQVSMLIRTMPDPMGQAPVRVPRETMLRELGLTTKPLTSRPLRPQVPQHSEPVEATPPRSKVGRNAPCPCGSGKKYKKCCGR